MHFYQSEGIILSSLKFRDYDQIITLFSKEEGIIKLIVKKSYTKKEGYGSKTSPFIQGQFIYSKGKSEIFCCQELSVLNYNLELRNRYQNLEAAAAMAKVIAKSQYPLKPAPLLYQLFTSYLQTISVFENPETLVLSLILKLLRHEGLFDIDSRCQMCQKELNEVHLFGNNSYCYEHKPKEAITLNSLEVKTIYQLAFSRSLKQLKEICYDQSLAPKIKEFSQQKLTF